MTRPTTFRFGEMLVEVGDGGSPEVFGAPCGLNAKAFNATADTNDTIVPDCDDPDAPAWKERAVNALSRDITGSGVLAQEFLATWDAWFASGLSKNVRVTLGAKVWLGAYLLSQFQITSNRGDKVQISITMQSDGQII